MANLSDSFNRLAVDLARLSRKTGIAEARTLEIAAGAQPSSTELRLIAAYLRMPADALLRLDQLTGGSDVRFRAARRHKNPYTAEARVREIEMFVRRRKLLPAPSHALHLTATLEDRTSIEAAALQIRRLLCSDDDLLEPMCDLPARLDASGLASSIVLSDLNVEGATTVTEGRGLIVIAARRFAPRMLFTCAHELAHLVLGHVTANRWIIDEDTIETFNNDREDEQLCDVLASAVLLPAEGVARFLKIIRSELSSRNDAISDTEILFLARYYGTSFIAAAIRLEVLGLLPKGGGFALEAEIKKQYASVEAYSEAQGLPERTPISMPTISPRLRDKIRVALSDGEISIGRTAETLGLSQSEIADALA